MKKNKYIEKSIYWFLVNLIFFSFVNFSSSANESNVDLQIETINHIFISCENIENNFGKPDKADYANYIDPDILDKTIENIYKVKKKFQYLYLLEDSYLQSSTKDTVDFCKSYFDEKNTNKNDILIIPTKKPITFVEILNCGDKNFIKKDKLKNILIKHGTKINYEYDNEKEDFKDYPWNKFFEDLDDYNKNSATGLSCEQVDDYKVAKFFYKNYTQQSEILNTSDTKSSSPDINKCENIKDNIEELKKATLETPPECKDQYDELIINNNIKTLNDVKKHFEKNNLENGDFFELDKIKNADFTTFNDIDQLDKYFNELNTIYQNFKTSFKLHKKIVDICYDKKVIKEQDTIPEYYVLCEKIKNLITIDRIIIYERDFNDGYIDENEKETLFKNFKKAYNDKRTELETEKNNKIKEEDLKKKIENLIDSIDEDIKKLNRDLNNELQEIKNLINDNNINKDTKEFTIPPDLKTRSKDLDNELDKLKIKIDEYTGTNTNFLTSYREFQYDLENIEEDLNDLNTEIDEYNQNILNEKAKIKEEEEEAKQKALEKARQKADEEEKERIKEEEEKKKKEKRKKIKELKKDIKELEKTIKIKLDELNEKLANSLGEVSDLLDEFDEFNDYNIKEFDPYLTEVKNIKQDINELINDYEYKINKLVDLVPDTDINQFNTSNYRDELADIDFAELKNKIDTFKDKISNISTLRDEKLEETKSEIEELDTKNENLNEEKKELSGKLTKTEDELNKKVETISNQSNEIINLNENIQFLKLIIYILIALIIVLLILCIYFFTRRSKQNIKNNTNDNQYLNRIEELEKKLENKAEVISKDNTDTDLKSFKDTSIKKAEPIDPQKLKLEKLKKLYEDYQSAMIDRKQRDLFKTNYNAIGMERDNRVNIKDKTILFKSNKSFDRADFWTVEHDNKLLVFVGYQLKVQAPSFLADDGTRARNLMKGIFQLEFGGSDFSTLKCAIVKKVNQIYEVQIEGKLQLPKIDN